VYSWLYVNPTNGRWFPTKPDVFSKSVFTSSSSKSSKLRVSSSPSRLNSTGALPDRWAKWEVKWSQNGQFEYWDRTAANVHKQALPEGGKLLRANRRAQNRIQIFAVH
jgi:hypothetical protein